MISLYQVQCEGYFFYMARNYHRTSIPISLYVINSHPAQFAISDKISDHMNNALDLPWKSNTGSRNHCIHEWTLFFDQLHAWNTSSVGGIRTFHSYLWAPRKLGNLNNISALYAFIIEVSLFSLLHIWMACSYDIFIRYYLLIATSEKYCYMLNYII